VTTHSERTAINNNLHTKRENSGGEDGETMQKFT